jgi:phage tail-like protein
MTEAADGSASNLPVPVADSAPAPMPGPLPPSSGRLPARRAGTAVPAIPTLAAARSPHWMLDQLPVGLLESDFFVRFVSLFQQIGETLLEDADNVEHLPDLTVTPDPLVRWLGGWIGVDSLDPSLPSELQRRIVKSAARTLSWRGTIAGLREFLELTTDRPAEVSDGGGVWRADEAPHDTNWVRMSVESTGWLTEADFIELVRDEVPAHVHAYLYVGDRLIWASDTDDKR